MKKFISGFLFVFITVSIFGQSNFVLDREVPRAGEFMEDTQIPYDVTNQYLKGEEGYDSLNMSFQGNWPLGKGSDIISSITGDTIFIAAGGAVLILDITDPATPQLISEVRARSLVDRLFFDYSTHHLYLAAYTSGFEIWDLSDFTNPTRLSRMPNEGLSRAGIYAYEEYLYVITVDDGMLIYDITDPVNPIYVATTSISGLAWNFYAEDNFIYIQLSSSIALYDITIPESPVLRDTYPSSSPKAIFVKDGLGYISDQNTGLTIIDVSDPDNLTLVGNLQITGAYDAVVINGFAYVADGYGGNDGGIYAIDVTDPSNPVQTDFYQNFYWAISGKNDKITALDFGYATFDVSVPGQLNLIQNTSLPHSVYDIAIKGDYAFTSSNGFRVLDISDKSNPQQVAYIDIFAHALDISGNILAHIPESMGSGNRLSIMDITDPLNTYEMGYYSNLGHTQEAIIQGDYVYIAGWWEGFTIIDISDPTSPTFVAKVHNWTNGAIPGDEWCYVGDLDVQGDFVYIIDEGPFPDEDTKGLYIFDISNPENPEFVTRYEQQSEAAWRIKVKDNYVYLGDGYGGVEVVDVSNPQAPVTVAYQEILMSSGLYNLDVSPFGFVYAAAYIYGGVQAIDISDPENPDLTGYYYPTSVFALNVTADGNDIYVSEGIGGFQIYDHEELINDVDEKIITALEMNAFPNPSNGFIYLDAENAKEVVVFDQAGRFLKKEKLNNGNTFLDLTDLPNGIYFLKFKLTDRIQLQKIVISR